MALLVDKNPEQPEIKGCLWTRRSVKEPIKRKYGITMPVRTAGEYLQRQGLTVQTPAKRKANQKAETAIHAEAAAEDAEIYRGDETAVQNTANYACGYAPKGQTPVANETPRGEDFSCQARKTAPGILYVFPSRMTKLDAKKTAANAFTARKE